jgi:hypothetical protein
MATATTPTRPPFPPFTRDSAVQKVRLGEDGWNTRDPICEIAQGSPAEGIGDSCDIRVVIIRVCSIHAVG